MIVVILTTGNARQTKYNIVSGSLTGGIQNSTRHFGEVYPQHGIIVLGAALDTSASLGTVRTQADNQNHNRLFYNKERGSKLFKRIPSKK